MTFHTDLDAYFQRIGDAGPRTPNLETLRRVIAAHVRSIPFENLDLLLGRGISLEPADIERKLVHDHRGGYCFEQNALLMQVLRSLGYDVVPLSARVHSEGNRQNPPARTHLFLRVELEGESWLADVGVGSMTPPAPLRLELDRTQETGHEPRRIVAEGSWDGLERRSPKARLFHQAWLGDGWDDVCDFTLEEMHAVDRELANWYTSTHPSSKFRRQLSVARVTEEGRVTLSNGVLKHRAKDGASMKRTLATHDELLEVLLEGFGIELPKDTQFDFPGLALKPRG